MKKLIVLSGLLILFTAGCSFFDSRPKTIPLKVDQGTPKENVKRSGQKDKSVEMAQGLKWINTSKWDKIIISKTNSSKERVEIKEKKFLEPKSNNFFWLFESLRKEKQPPGEFRSDEEHYTYEFIKGDKTYTVNVVDRGVVEIDHDYYKASRYVHNLGKAFLPAPKFIQTHSVLNKIWESGVVIGQLQYQSPEFSSFRIRGLVKFLQEKVESGEAVLLSNPPKNVGEIKEKLTFYYYGQKIFMEIYQSYICIKDDRKVNWYLNNSQPNILIVLGAG